jgi:hypothetical protein
MDWINWFKDIGGSGCIGALVGFALTWIIPTTTPGGFAILIIIPTLVGVGIGSLVTARREKKDAK